MTNKKVNPADILISPLGMENLLVIDQFNDEVIKNNELLLDKPYFSLEDVLDGLNKDGHYLIIVESPLCGKIYRYNNYCKHEIYLVGKMCGYAWKEWKLMYISEFWCGVGATLLCELAMLICYAVYFDKKRRKKK